MLNTKTKVQVNILLDRSGSMKSLWSEALASINAYVDNLDPKTKINFAVFDDHGYDVLKNCLVKDWTPVDPDTVQPRGMTPLYDSIVRSIKTAESINADKTVLVVMTDGHENCSKNTTLFEVKNTLQLFTDRGWQTVFLGANFDSINLVAKSVGVSADHYVNFKQNTMVMNMADLGTRTMSYASADSIGISYTDADKTKLANE